MNKYMIFQQLFDDKSSTYTYIISSGEGREALIIDPVIEHTEKYIKILENLKLKLVKVCLLYTSPSPRDHQPSRMPSSA